MLTDLFKRKASKADAPATSSSAPSTAERVNVPSPSPSDAEARVTSAAAALDAAAQARSVAQSDLDEAHRRTEAARQAFDDASEDFDGAPEDTSKGGVVLLARDTHALQAVRADRAAARHAEAARVHAQAEADHQAALQTLDVARLEARRATLRSRGSYRAFASASSPAVARFIQAQAALLKAASEIDAAFDDANAASEELRTLGENSSDLTEYHRPGPIVQAWIEAGGAVPPSLYNPSEGAASLVLPQFGRPLVRGLDELCFSHLRFHLHGQPPAEDEARGQFVGELDVAYNAPNVYAAGSAIANLRHAAGDVEERNRRKTFWRATEPAPGTGPQAA